MKNFRIDRNVKEFFPTKIHKITQKNAETRCPGIFHIQIHFQKEVNNAEECTECATNEINFYLPFDDETKVF